MVTNAAHKVFFKWGQTVACRPRTVIAVSFFLSMLSMSRLWLSFAGKPLETEVQGEKPLLRTFKWNKEE